MQNAWGRFLKYLMGILLLGSILFSLYTWGTLKWVYSLGERAGYVQKFSLKGWVCKTWEGELVLVSMPGTQAEKFYFTVKNDALAAKINNDLGKKVRLTYEQHVGLPTACFGETGYFVSDVQILNQ